MWQKACVTNTLLSWHIFQTRSQEAIGPSLCKHHWAKDRDQEQCPEPCGQSQLTAPAQGPGSELLPMHPLLASHSLQAGDQTAGRSVLTNAQVLTEV